MQFEGKVIGTADDATLVRFDGAGPCGHCRGCGGVRENTVLVPGTYDERISAAISMPDLLVVLSHSLLLPLAGFVGGALVAAIVGADDLIAALLGLTGLVTGLALCRRQSSNRLQITEVPHE